MAPGKDAVEFNKIIQANRDKKKKQDLADKIFSRRSSAPPAAGPIGGRKGPAGPSSLASRIGVAKPNKASKSANPPAKVQNGNAALKRTVSTPQLASTRRNLALDALVSGRPTRAHNLDDQVNTRGYGGSRGGAGFSIKGSASQRREYVVVAQNFAPGTTAADVASVFAPDEDEAGLISCQLLVSQPTVIAELVFDNQNTAEDVVKKFNNRTADSRVLYVYHADAPSRPQNEGRQGRSTGLAARISGVDDSMMDTDDARPRYQQPYTPPRGQRSQPDVQDGRYGFGDNVYRPRHEARAGGGLVSDGMISRQGQSSNQGGRRQFKR